MHRDRFATNQGPEPVTARQSGSIRFAASTVNRSFRRSGTAPNSTRAAAAGRGGAVGCNHMDLLKRDGSIRMARELGDEDVLRVAMSADRNVQRRNRLLVHVDHVERHLSDAPIGQGRRSRVSHQVGGAEPYGAELVEGGCRVVCAGEGDVQALALGKRAAATAR